MATIRDIFHSLGNDHNLIAVGADVASEAVKECLAGDVPQEIRDKLARVHKNLARIAKNVQDADGKTRELQRRVYIAIDPDTEITE